MATFTVTHHQRLANVAVVQTLENTEIAVGQSMVLAGLGHGLNGTHTVLAVPTRLFIGVDDEGDWLFDEDVIVTNQLLFNDAGDDVPRSAADPYGTLTWTATCTWIVNANVTEFLGIAVASANDTAFITTCVSAANQFAYRKRQEAGYADSLTTSPGGDVTLGTTLYAAGLYRERGSIDSFQSFQDMSVAAPTMTMGRVMQLLGCNRSQVA